MKSYRNKIRRKKQIRNFKRKLIRLINMVDAPQNETQTLHTKLWKEIEEGLEFGYEPRYYKRCGSIYDSSIEMAFKEYHGVTMVSEYVLNETYNFLKDYIKEKAEEYKDLNWITGEDENGEYFQVSLID